MLFPKKDLLVFFSNRQIAHHIKPCHDGYKKLPDIKKQPKESPSRRPFVEGSKNLGDISLSAKRVCRTSFISKEIETFHGWSLAVSKHFSSGFMLLGVEYFYPIYEGIKKGKPNLPPHFETMGPIYFKGTRMVNSDGHLVIPYIEYIEDQNLWRAGLKKSDEIIEDTEEMPRTLCVCIKKEPRRFNQKKKVPELIF